MCHAAVGDLHHQFSRVLLSSRHQVFALDSAASMNTCGSDISDASRAFTHDNDPVLQLEPLPGHGLSPNLNAVLRIGQTGSAVVMRAVCVIPGRPLTLIRHMWKWQANTVHLLHPAMTTAVVTIWLFGGLTNQRAVSQIAAAEDIFA